MNPWGVIFIGLGIIMVIIGVKGSQHSVKDAFASLSPNYTPQASTTTPSTVSQTGGTQTA